MQTAVLKVNPSFRKCLLCKQREANLSASNSSVSRPGMPMLRPLFLLSKRIPRGEAGLPQFAPGGCAHFATISGFYDFDVKP